MRRPLFRALFLADSELLGKLARPGSGARERRHQLVSHAYFELLAEHGLLRGDLSADGVAYAFLATLEGFIQAEASAGDQRGSGIEERAELLALTVQEAFETGRRVPPAAAKTIAARVIDMLARLGDADRADLGIGDDTPVATTTRS